MAIAMSNSINAKPFWPRPGRVRRRFRASPLVLLHFILSALSCSDFDIETPYRLSGCMMPPQLCRPIVPFAPFLREQASARPNPARHIEQKVSHRCHNGVSNSTKRITFGTQDAGEVNAHTALCHPKRPLPLLYPGRKDRRWLSRTAANAEAPNPIGLPVANGDRGGFGFPQAADFLSSQYSRLSANASQLASMMFSELPTVRHWWRPSPDSISTLTCDSVPALSSRMRTL